MMWLCTLWAIVTLTIWHDFNPCRPNKKLPDNFLLGASTAAYQIEGSWNIDGKGESIVDYFFHKLSGTADFPNGDIASNSYVLYERDIELLKYIGAKSYRFSISWTRILPDGTTKYINQLGIAHYRRFIELLLQNDILPLVTMYHWDMPIGIEDKGGWLNETTVDLFGEYARVVFDAFGDKVKHWMTVNEPFTFCKYSQEYHFSPLPLPRNLGIGCYECVRHMLLAHARAYHIYEEEFRDQQRGRVGIALDIQWPLAATDSKDDAEAVEDYLAFQIGHYMDPIFKTDYPQRVVKRVAAASAAQGYPASRLRPLSEQEKAYIHGTADFVGVNHYSSLVVYRNESVVGMFNKPSLDDDAGVGIAMDSSWPASAMYRMKDYSPGFYSLLMYLKDTYSNPVVYVTESGFPLTSAEGLNDDQKVKYIRNYLDALHDAKMAGSNCQGYFIWSLMDTYEWGTGYKLKFGLYQVDFEDPNRNRTARKSALVYKEIIRTGTIDHNYDPDPYEQQ